MVENPHVAVAEGRLEGITENSVHKFLGIPYAAPPVGDRRWRVPAPPLVWSGTRAATQFGPCAMQVHGAVFDLRVTQRSEDCLYLNVWTRSLDASDRRPVMVWIHGGGNLGGAGSEDAYDGTRFAEQGVVLVTINYRLGAFGFLSHPSLGANFAVLDWIAALQWVRENIAQFGGDPSNVTIFGESAGAVAVRMLLSSPRADGLFQKAIMESGGGERAAFAPELSWADARQAAERLFERVGTSNPEALRQLPSAVIGQASHDLCGIPPPPGRIHTPAHLVWGPFADGDVVLPGADPLRREDIPVLMGCNENEARYFLKPGGIYPPPMLAGITALLAGIRRDDVAAALASTPATVYESIDRLFTAAIFAEPAYETARRLSQSGRRLFYYHFGRVAPGAAASQELAKHSGEIRYVFNNLTAGGYYDERDAQLAAHMQAAWVAFATTGIPASAADQPWPAFQSDNPQMTFIGNAIETRPFAVSKLIELLNSMRAPSGVRNPE
ncbi:Carboxylesterase [Paraburkholderia caffeinitolerans]|uniref:Carboxylic ester hydrolase n=1 Tax=Paraburkholderia caffeinitolerans TaxID=1723730 RepID=A0A6J5G4L1_9BURK|nr:carboxylesterase family protein [Paraburkholderia caffeinitolerans]CAB3793373.1 Carboxylesterase [Paraburkholderia caffeinitolerans]